MPTVAEVQQQLVQGDLLTPEAASENLARWRQQAAPGDGPDQWLAWMVGQGAITRLAADAVLAGAADSFRVGPFRILDRLEVEELGRIYRAVHEASQQPVCLKVFSASPDNPQQAVRMERELRASTELDHPNVVRAYATGEFGDVYYLALEDLRGQTLHEMLAREGRLDVLTACRLMCDAARGLAHFHDRFMIHRDVRPATMWVGAGGLKVLASGTLRQAFMGLDQREATVTTTGTMLGAQEYLSPEQAEDPRGADHRSDIYSLGCVAYHCLAGQPPFVEKNPLKLLLRHAKETPAPLSDHAPDVPEQVADAVAVMLAKAPEERYQSMEDVVRALEPFAELPPEAEEDAVPAEFLQGLSEGPAASPEPPGAFVQWLARDAAK